MGLDCISILCSNSGISQGAGALMIEPFATLLRMTRSGSERRGAGLFVELSLLFVSDGWVDLRVSRSVPLVPWRTRVWVQKRFPSIKLLSPLLQLAADT